MKFLSFLFLLLFASCFSQGKKEESPSPSMPNIQPLTIHPEEIDAKEKEKLELLDKYRKMREQSLVRGKKTKKKHTSILPVSLENKIEIEQNIAYLCIKYEGRFSRAEDCKAHAENVLTKCREEKSENLINCLKKNM